MRQRGTVSRKPAKTQHRKPTRPKRSNAPTTARQGSPSVADLQEKLDTRTRQLNEAIERRECVAEVLRSSVLTERPAASFRRHPGERDAAVRGQIRYLCLWPKETRFAGRTAWRPTSIC